MSDFKFYPKAAVDSFVGESVEAHNDSELTGFDMTVKQLQANCCGDSSGGTKRTDIQQKILEELITETLSLYPKGLHNLIRRKMLESSTSEQVE